VHHELVLIDQSEFRERQRELHAAQAQSFARLPLELRDGRRQIAAPQCPK
jgi:hypothetical protein